MKKVILGSIIAIMAINSANAAPYQYQKKYPIGYMFGFNASFQMNNAELDDGRSGETNYGWGVGVDTYYTYDIGDRMFTGVKAGATYMFGTGYLDANSWGVYAEPRIGYKFDSKINAYIGAGYQYDSYEEYEDTGNYSFFYDPEKRLDYSISGPYVSIGLDYIMSEDLILGVKYTRGFSLSIDNEQAIGDLYKIDQKMDQNKLRFEVTIPFR